MIEEPIDALLEVCGETLEFPSGNVLGISFADLTYLDNAPYQVQQLEISFMIKTLDLIENEIKTGDSFLIVAGSKEYTFSIKSNPVSDLSGWSLLLVNFIESLDV